MREPFLFLFPPFLLGFCVCLSLLSFWLGFRPVSLASSDEPTIWLAPAVGHRRISEHVIAARIRGDVCARGTCYLARRSETPNKILS